MRIDKFIFAFFSFVFVLVGVIFSDFLLSQKFLIISTFVSVYLGLDLRFAIEKIEIANFQPLLILINSSLLYFIILMAVHGVPILSNDVELSRVEVLQEGGIFYRIFLSGIFAIPILMTRRNAWTNKIYFGAGLIILLMLAFRSRILDFIFMTALALMLSRGVTRIRLSGLVKLIILASPFVIVIVGLTSIRTGIPLSGELVEVVLYRVFVLNTEQNIAKVFNYYSEAGINYGLSYLTDIIAIFSEWDSMAEVLTKWNKSLPGNSNTVMTPTVFSELYFNFGFLSPVFGYVLGRWYSLIIRFMLKKVAYLGNYYSGVRSWLILFTLYYIPRVIVTGGFSNAMITKFTAGFMCVGFIWVITRFFRT